MCFLLLCKFLAYFDTKKVIKDLKVLNDLTVLRLSRYQILFSASKPLS